MSLKIADRSPVIWNCIFFAVSSLLFLYLQHVSINYTSLLNTELFITFMSSSKFVTLIVTLSILSLYFMKPYAKHLFLFLSIMTAVLTVMFLLSTFSKIILVLLFIYLFSTTYLYQFLSLELSGPFYQACFKPDELIQYQTLQIPLFASIKNEKIEGVLTNWDDDGLFVRLTELKKIPLGKIHGSILYNGKSYSFEGKVVARLGEHGFGVRVKLVDTNDTYNWYALNNILKNKGLIPEMIL